MNNILISPSILTSDFTKILDTCDMLIANGADMIHFDVMDGVFVPNLTFGMKLIADLRSKLNCVFDVHLMIDNPIKFVEQFAKAGADIITVHIEACRDINATLETIRGCGVKCGLSLKPSSPIETIMPYVDSVDMILIMSVEPGFGGQKFMSSAIDKIKAVRSANSQIDIQVDGGINHDNIREVISAGANVIVAGNSIMGASDIKQAISQLRG